MVQASPVCKLGGFTYSELQHRGKFRSVFVSGFISYHNNSVVT